MLRLAMLYSVEGLFLPEIPLLLQLMPPRYSVLPSVIPNLVRPKPNQITQDQQRDQKQFDSHRSPPFSTRETTHGRTSAARSHVQVVILRTAFLAGRRTSALVGSVGVPGECIGSSLRSE
jgi:hypothetical protein